MLQIEKNKKEKGFTLPELLVIIAIISILAVGSFLSYTNFKKRTQLRAASDEIVSTLRSAQAETLASVGGQNYGIHFEANKYILFPGATYNPLGLENKIHEVPDTLEIYDIVLAGGGSEVVFDRLTGNTAYDGSVKIRIKGTGQLKTIIIESAGTVSVE